MEMISRHHLYQSVVTSFFFLIVKFVFFIGINPEISHFYKKRLISFND